MDSRERTLRAIAHRQVDRIPVDFWGSKGLIRKLEAALGVSYDEFLDAHDVDLRYIAGSDYIGPSLAPRADGLSPDIWGVLRRTVRIETAGGAEAYDEVAESPLAAAETVEEILAYPGWPSPDWFRYDCIEAQCDAVHARGRAAVFMGDRLNRVAQLKPAMYLRGVERILTDLVIEPGIAHAVLAKIRAFYLAYLERILDAAQGKIDIVLTGDDFGSQRGLLIGPALWDEYLREGFSQYLSLIRSHGVKSMHHTCGAVGPLVPRFIECGLDVLQSLQPEAAGMDLAELRAQTGARIAFHGGISIQNTLPFGSPDDVRREVERIAQAAGNEGGYIFCTSHNLQADVPIANVEALMRAYRDFGRRG